MKRILLFLPIILLCNNAVADGYNRFNKAEELFKAKLYKDAKRSYEMCVQYYPDDDLDWGTIKERVKTCKSKIEESDKKKKQLEEANKKKSEERLKQNRIYVSAFATNILGGEEDISSYIKEALSSYGFTTSLTEEEACWSLSVTADAVMRSATIDGSTISSVKAYSIYDLNHLIEYYTPAYGDGPCESSSEIRNNDLIGATKNTYKDLAAKIAVNIQRAIKGEGHNINTNSNYENENKTIAIILSTKGDNQLTESDLQPLYREFKKGFERNSGFEVVNRTNEVMSIRNKELNYDDIIANPDLLISQMPTPPNYICVLGVEYVRKESNYNFYAELLSIGTTISKGSTSYPNYNKFHDAVKEISTQEMQRVSLYLIQDLDEGVHFMSSNQRKKWDDDISNYESNKPKYEQELKKKEQTMAEDLRQQELKRQKDRDNEIKKHNQEANRHALCASVFIPGRGLKLKGHKTEGSIYMISEIATIVGGGIALAYAGNQQNILSKKGIDYKTFTTANDNKNKAETACKGLFITAGIIYAVNLARSYFAEPVGNSKIQWQYSFNVQPIYTPYSAPSFTPSVLLTLNF